MIRAIVKYEVNYPSSFPEKGGTTKIEVFGKL